MHTPSKAVSVAVAPKPPACQPASRQPVSPTQTLQKDCPIQGWPCPAEVAHQVLAAVGPDASTCHGVLQGTPIAQLQHEPNLCGRVCTEHTVRPHLAHRAGTLPDFLSFLVLAEFQPYCNPREATRTCFTPCLNTPTPPQTAPNSLAVLLVQGLPGCTCIALQLACSLCPATQASSQSHTYTLPLIPCDSRTHLQFIRVGLAAALRGAGPCWYGGAAGLAAVTATVCGLHHI